MPAFALMIIDVSQALSRLGHGRRPEPTDDLGQDFASLSELRQRSGDRRSEHIATDAALSTPSQIEAFVDAASGQYDEPEERNGTAAAEIPTGDHTDGHDDVSAFAVRYASKALKRRRSPN
jgi:hypothetical protein